MESIDVISKNFKFLILLLNVFLLLIASIFNSTLIVVNLFSFIYIFIIYKNFSCNNRKYLYYILLLYSLITGGNSKYVFIFYFIYFICLFLECKNNKIDIIRNKKYYIFFSIFILYMILSIFIANNKIVAFDYMLRYMLMLAIFIMMIIENRNRKELNETFKFLLLFYIGMLFLGGLEVCGIKYGLSNIFMDKHMTSSYLTRIPEVFFYNPNNYSIVLDVGIAALFIRSLFVESRRERLFYYFLIFVSEIELIFASSRIAWIVLYGTFILIFLLGFVTIKNDKKLGKKSIINSMVAFMLSFVLFFCLALLPSMAPYYKKFADSIIINNVREAVLPDGYVNKIKIEEDHNIDAKIEIGGKGSENERVTLIKNVIDGVIVEKNYLGFGVGNIGVYIKNKANTYGIINVHSFWFEFLGDFGIPMFIYLIIIYCIMLLDTFKLYWNKQGRLKQYYMILLLLGIIMVPLAFSPSSVMTVSPFWIILGMNFGIVSVK